MPDAVGAETSLRKIIDAVLRAELTSVADRIQPDVLDGLMELGNFTARVEFTGYKVAVRESDAEGVSFEVLFETPARDYRAEVTMHEIEGLWQMAELDIPSLNEFRLMPRTTAAETLLAACEAAFGAEVFTFIDDLTSQAYVDLLKIVQAMENLDNFKPDHYTFEPLDDESDQQHFSLRLTSDESDTEMAGTVTVQKVKNRWKVAAIKIPGIRE